MRVSVRCLPKLPLSSLFSSKIFGRAGRPQYDNTGHAILITPHKSLNNYLALLGQQSPIESGFIKSLVDHMNAEVVNGTITNIKEAALWLSYTFLFVRMGKNPVAYGMSYEEKFDDPQLDKKRQELVREAAETLDKCMMVRFDRRSGNLAVTDLGRVASYYYIKCGTIEAFNAMLSSHMTDAEALHVLCSSAEFDQLKLRPEELSEIDLLLKEAIIPVKGQVEETPGMSDNTFEPLSASLIAVSIPHSFSPNSPTYLHFSLFFCYFPLSD